jgi:hypothetical protein
MREANYMPPRLRAIVWRRFCLASIFAILSYCLRLHFSPNEVVIRSRIEGGKSATTGTDRTIGMCVSYCP